MSDEDFYRTYSKADLKILLKHYIKEEEERWEKYIEAKDKVETIERIILEAE